MKQVFHTLSIVFSRLAAFFSSADSLHKARFAKPHELGDLLTDTLPDESLLLGVGRFSRLVHVRQTPARRELGNLLVVAPTRGGKGLLATSQLLTWRHSVVVNDIKGELFDQTAGYRATFSSVYVLDPRGIGHRFDPLAGRLTEDDLYASAKNLLYEPGEGEGKAFTQRATKLLTLLFLAGLERNRQTGVDLPLLPFVGQLADVGLPSAAAVLNAISPVLARRLLDGEYAPDREYDENKFLTSSWESLTARLFPLLTEKTLSCFGGSDFTGREVIAGERPVTVYLRWPESDVLAKAPLITLVWESLLKEMIDTYDSARGEGCRPVLLLVDEAANSPIPSLHRYAATVAGRGITLWLALQALSQLEGLYGKHKADTIINNCDSQLFYRQASLETAKYLETSLGYRSGYARSQTTRDGQEASSSLGEQAIPLLTAQEIKQLSYTEIIGCHANRPPFRAARMDWRNFPLLRQRRAITPPRLLSVPPVPASPELVAGGGRTDMPHFPIDPDGLN
jgi:type IV secretion system protein VirD4